MAYIKKHGFWFLTSFIFAVVVFAFLVPIMIRVLARKPRLYVGMIGEHTLYTLPQSIKEQLSVGLTKIEPDGSVRPLLAERFVVEEDGKRYRFLLKKKITWQDGKELVPQDIKYNFTDVETVYTPNDVVFKLPDLFSPFPGVVSEPLFRQGTEKYLFFFDRPTLIGIGEYQIVDYKLRGNYVKELTVDGPNQRFLYRFYLTEQEALAAFKKGEIDLLSDLSSPQDLADWKTVDIAKTTATDRYLAIFFNTNDPLLPKNVRQALAYAIDIPEDVSRAISPINPTSWAFLDGGKVYYKDVDRAVERLLDGLPNAPLKLELTTTSLFIKEAEQYQRQWEALGDEALAACRAKKDADQNLCANLDITVNLKITNFPDTTNFQLLLIGQEIPDDPDQYFLWHSGQPTNFTRYSNTRIDSLLEKGRQTLDQVERKAIYQEFQQFLQEDPPAIFIRHLETYTVKRR